MVKEYYFPAIYQKDDIGYSLYFPDIEEAYTCGDDELELFKNAREVLSLSIEGRIEDEKDIPKPSSVESKQLKDNEKILIISIELDEKIEYVKKTLTIPKRLNTRACKAKINFSKILSIALEQELDKAK